MVIYRAKYSAALTFDDGPNPKVTPKVLDVLANNGVKATFFLIGMRAKQYPEIVKRILQEGHELGNHSYTHKRLARLLSDQGEDAVRVEIEKGHEVIKKVAGIGDAELQFFRPPYLDWDDSVGKLAEPLYGNRIIMAHSEVGDYDWGGDHIWEENDSAGINKQAGRITKYWYETAVEGTLVCSHDSAEYDLPGNKTYPNWQNRALPTLEALPLIISDLRSKNITVKKMSELNLIEEQFTLPR